MISTFKGTGVRLKDIPEGVDPTGMFVLRATDKVPGKVVQAWGQGNDERVVIQWLDNKRPPRDWRLRGIPLEVATNANCSVSQ